MIWWACLVLFSADIHKTRRKITSQGDFCLNKSLIRVSWFPYFLSSILKKKLHSFSNVIFYASKYSNQSNYKLYQSFLPTFLKWSSNKPFNSFKREIVSNSIGAINNMGFQISFYKTRFLKSIKQTLDVLVLRKFTVTTISNSLISNMSSSL